METSYMYSEFIQSSYKAFESSQYGAALDYLGAAFSCSKTDEDIEALELIEQTAHNQLAWIDKYMPHSRFSSQKAKLQKRPNLYDLLIRRIQGTILRIQQKQQQSQIRNPMLSRDHVYTDRLREARW